MTQTMHEATPETTHALTHAPIHELAARLVGGWKDGIPFTELPPDIIPVNAEAAYAVQAKLLAARGSTIGAWKVGAKTPGGEAKCSPLPEDCLHHSGVVLPQAAYRPLGLELEIAFILGRQFAPRANGYDNEEVLDSITHMAAAIEIVASRYREWPAVDPLAQLADLQNHGALILGERVDYQPDFPFATPDPTFTFDNECAIDGPPLNPAGDPRQLLPWLVNHATQRGLTLRPGVIITTGSYTGMYFPQGSGPGVGGFPGLPPVNVTLS